MRPIFIGGTGRSGTTVLKSILAQHPKVKSMPFELRVIVDPGGALDLVDNLSDLWTPYNADIALHQFLQLLTDCQQTYYLKKVIARLISYLGVSPFRYPSVGIGSAIGRRNYQNKIVHFKKELNIQETSGYWAGSLPFRMKKRMYETGPYTRAEAAARVAELFVSIFNCQPGYDEATHWLDDTPYNLLQAHRLYSLFPEMKLLHIYRDPRDVISSYRTKIWGGRDVTVIANRIKGILDRWWEIRKQLPRTLYLEVSLEEMADKTQENLEEICSFLGLTFHKALLEVKLNRVNSGRWRKDLTVDEQLKVNHILAPYIGAMGYSI